MPRISFYEQAARAPVTFALIAVNVLFAYLEHRWEGGDATLTMVRMGAIVPRRVDAIGLATTLSYAYLHFGALHLFVNMFALYNLGLLLEPAFGSARFYVLYTLSAIGGGLLVASFEQRQAVTAGASGAIFGLLGAICVVFWQMRGRTRSPERRKDLGGLVFRLLGPNILISLIPGVSFLGHLGGLLVGGSYVALGFFKLPAFRTPEQDERERGRDAAYRALAVLLAAITVLAVTFVWLVARPWQPRA